MLNKMRRALRTNPRAAADKGVLSGINSAAYRMAALDGDVALGRSPVRGRAGHSLGRGIKTAMQPHRGLLYLLRIFIG